MLLEALPDAFIRVGADGRVAVCNECARAVFASLGGISPGREWRPLMSEDEAARFERLVNGLGVGATVRQEFTFGSAGNSRRLRVHLRRLADGFSGTLHQGECAAVAPPIFVGAAEIWLPADFLPRLSHELKTHISAAQAASFLLRNHGRDLAGANEQKWQASIKQAIVSLREVLEQMDMLERMLVDETASAVEAIDIPAWLEGLVGRARKAALMSTVTLTTRSTVEGEWRLDENLLATAVECLLSNALKFGPAGSQASLEVREDEGALELVVADAGPGVAADEAPRLFTPFFQGQNSRNLPGCGLGLAIARAAVSRLGGAVSYHRASRGTEFRIRVPADPKK